MKALFKKTLCIISSAIMLCGASSITANAGRGIEGRLPEIPELSIPVEYGKTVYNVGYYLNGYDFEITPSETATLEAKTDRVLDINWVANYQWYKDGKPIDGATSNTYPAKSAGEYYCEIKEHRAFSVTTTTTAGGFKPMTTRTTAVLPSIDRPRVTTTDSGLKLEDFGMKRVTTTTPGIRTPWGGVAAVTTTTAAPVIVSKVDTYTTGKATVKRVAELKIVSQSNSSQDLKYNTQLFVNPTGGSGKYSYTWTDAQGKWVGNGQRFNVPFEGNYKCEVKDSSGRKAYSREITVGYKKMNAYFDPPDTWYGKNTIWFEKDEALDKQKSIRVYVNSGGTGKYTYRWQILTSRYSNPKWIDTGNYTSTIIIKKDDIKDRCWRFSKPIYAGCNDYRCIISSLNCNGDVIETKTLEIDVYGEFDI